MKISKIGYVFIYLGIAIILGYLCFSIWSFSAKDKDLICKKLEIKMLDGSAVRLISDAEVATILDNSGLNPIGKMYKDIQTEMIEKELKKNPVIKQAECYKTPSGKIYLNVKQRIPKFMVAGQENYYVDNDRQLIPVSLNYAVYVPVVSGRVIKSMACGQLFDFVSFLELNPFWNAQIEQIYVRDDMKIELVPRVGDAIILLGKLDNYETKLNKLQKLYLQGFNVIGWNRYKTIDLEYEDQIVCSKTGIVRVAPVFCDSLRPDSLVLKKDSVAKKL